MLIKDVLEKTTKFFKDKKIETARLDSELLISSALNLSRVDLYLKFDQPLKEQEVVKCRELVRRRSLGEPVAYILGHKDFYKNKFFVDNRVLIPRPETELMVEYAIHWLQLNNIENPNILDLGCGSGCIGLSLANHNKTSKVTLLDKSKEAIEVCEINRKSLNLEAQTNLVHSEVNEFNFLNSSYDVIVANPPYISSTDVEIQENVKKFEPELALFSENEGMKDIYDWSSAASKALKQTSLMIFEIGYKQGDKTKNHFENLKTFSTIKVLKDFSGLDRFVVGEKNNG